MKCKELLLKNKKELLTKNSLELKYKINSKEFSKKIENLYNRNPDLDFSNIKEEILKGNNFAIALLKKDPKKQNVSEKTFFEYTGLEKLPPAGRGSFV